LIKFALMDKFLKKAIENELVKKPSQGFSDKVMSQIFELKGKIEIQPLISIKIWIGAACALTAIIAASVLFKPQSDVNTRYDFFSKIENFFSAIQFPKIDFFMNINLLIISGVCLALFLLLFFDLVLFKRNE
jgi:hypothetical protein